MLLSTKQVFLLCGIGFGTATTLAFLYFTKRKKWTKVATVSQLFLHPIKSTRGISVNSVQVSSNGAGLVDSELPADRCFMVVYDNGQMLNARHEPRIVLICTEINEENIILSAPEMQDITVSIPRNPSEALKCRIWGEDIPGADCGDDVADWLKTYFNIDCRLVYFPPNQKPRDICKKDKEIATKCSGIGKIIYQDCAPINILSEASVEDLNSRLGDKVTPRNFRPSIVVKNCCPFEEDKWRHVKIGKSEMKFAKWSGRCVMTTINPQTGVKDSSGEPLKTLKAYRLCDKSERSLYKEAPLLGTYFGVVKTGRINVGDDVYAA